MHRQSTSTATPFHRTSSSFRFNLVLVSLTLLLLVRVTTAQVVAPAAAASARCEPITIPLCTGIRYNMTRMPNLVGHVTQLDAAQQLNEFIPLIQLGCSRLLKFFLCSLYAPMCTEQVDETLIIPACRSMCLEVRSTCEPVLTRFNFRWPDVLDCSGLPDHSDRTNLCIDPPASDWDSAEFGGGSAAAVGGVGVPPSGIPGTPGGRGWLIPPAGLDSGTGQRVGDAVAAPGAGGRGGAGGLMDEEVPGSFRNNPEWMQLLAALRAQSTTAKQQHYSAVSNERGNSAGSGNQAQAIPRCSDRFVHVESLHGLPGNESCSPRCGIDVLYRAEDKKFAESWLTVWAAVCVTSSLLTVVTFLLDTARIRCPERPIVYLSACYCAYAASHLLRSALGAEAVSCSAISSVQTTRPSVASSFSTAVLPPQHLVRRGLDNTACTVVFVIGYYFTQAASTWWVLLAVAWYLAAGRKWGVEAIESLESYFHLVAWSVPAALTVAVVVLRRVDADELTGLCAVGAQDAPALAGFVLAPLAVSLVLGVVLLAAGFTSMFRIRRELRLNARRREECGCRPPLPRSAASVDGLERLMTKTAVFALLYVAPLAGVVGCLAYELNGIRSWRSEAERRPCSRMTSSGNGMHSFLSVGRIGGVPSASDCALEASIPTVEVMIVRLFLQTAVGITAGMWTWSPKAVELWRATIARLLCGRATGGSENCCYCCGGVQTSAAGNKTKTALPSIGSGGVATVSLSRTRQFDKRSRPALLNYVASNTTDCRKAGATMQPCYASRTHSAPSSRV